MEVCQVHQPYQSDFVRLSLFKPESWPLPTGDMGDESVFGSGSYVPRARAAISQELQGTSGSPLATEPSHSSSPFQAMECVDEDLVHFPAPSVGFSDPLASPAHRRNQSTDSQIQNGMEDPLLSYQGMEPCEAENGMASATVPLTNAVTDFVTLSDPPTAPPKKQTAAKLDFHHAFESPSFRLDDSFCASAPLSLALPVWAAATGPPFADTDHAVLSANLSLQPYMSDRCSYDETTRGLASGSARFSTPGAEGKAVSMGTIQNLQAGPATATAFLYPSDQQDACVAASDAHLFAPSDRLEFFAGAEVMPCYGTDERRNVPDLTAVDGNNIPESRLFGTEAPQLSTGDAREGHVPLPLEAALLGMDIAREVDAPLPSQNNLSSSAGSSRTQKKKKEGRDKTMNTCPACGDKELHIRHKECKKCNAPRCTAPKK